MIVALTIDPGHVASEVSPPLWKANRVVQTWKTFLQLRWRLLIDHNSIWSWKDNQDIYKCMQWLHIDWFAAPPQEEQYLSPARHGCQHLGEWRALVPRPPACFSLKWILVRIKPSLDVEFRPAEKIHFFNPPPPYLPLSVNASVVVDTKDQTHLRSSATLHYFFTLTKPLLFSFPIFSHCL